MNEQIIDQVLNVFRRVFHNPHLEIKVADTANSIPGWDSLTHMTLINELENLLPSVPSIYDKIG
jgi:acyl carrier protein